MTNELNKSPPHTPLPWGNDQTAVLYNDGDVYPLIADIITDNVENPERPLLTLNSSSAPATAITNC